MPGMATRTDQLVAACQAGDADAWAALVEQLGPLVYYIARRFGLDEDDRAEVFQTTWSLAWTELPRLRDPHRFPQWLAATAARQARQCAEQRQRSRQERVGLDDSIEAADADPLVQPERQVELEEQSIAVRRALERLYPRCRDLLVLLFFDPRAPTYEQIARNYDTTTNAIQSLRRRCLRHLEAILRDIDLL
jgi:RNA polymerase sigma factor (sigma-70 family)